jgi:hypothetical protein
MGIVHGMLPSTADWVERVDGIRGYSRIQPGMQPGTHAPDGPRKILASNLIDTSSDLVAPILSLGCSRRLCLFSITTAGLSFLVARVPVSYRSGRGAVGVMLTGRRKSRRSSQASQGLLGYERVDFGSESGSSTPTQYGSFAEPPPARQSLNPRE